MSAIAETRRQKAFEFALAVVSLSSQPARTDAVIEDAGKIEKFLSGEQD